MNWFLSFIDNKPQTLLFSATVPHWVKDTARKYMDKNYKTFDLIGKDINKSSTTVEVFIILIIYNVFKVKLKS